MSNALALAAVTAVLRDLLNDGVIDNDLATHVGSVRVTSLPPDRIATGDTEDPRLNLFLYHVSPNAGWRNAAYPAFDARGGRISNPPLALDLHYLLTAYGATELHQEILLGYGMQMLHETPLLTREAIRRSLGSPSPVDPSPLPPAFQSLSAAGLAAQPEVIKVTPESISTEEMSRLWTAFQARYRPTAAYRASVVLIQAERSTKVALPVGGGGGRISALPIRDPIVERVAAAGGETDPILAAGTIVIRGQRLRGADTLVIVGGREVEPAADAVSQTEIRVELPAGLHAGVQGVQVVHRLPLGDPPVPHRAAGSNVAPFVLSPTLASLEVDDEEAEDDGRLSGTLTAVLAPGVGRDQNVVLLLNEPGAPEGRAPFVYSFPALPRDDGDDATEVVFAYRGVEPGRYLVRVQVDGAASPLGTDADPASDTFGMYVVPEVVLG